MARKNNKNGYKVLDLNYVSLYFEDLEKAKKFYSKLFGQPDYKAENLYGWKMGATWLTIFSSSAGIVGGANPQNTEYAIQVEEPEHVEILYQKLLDLGSKVCHKPEDTWMYEDMRFACVDDPFGTRIDIYSQIEGKS